MYVNPDRRMLLPEILRQFGIRHQMNPKELHALSNPRCGAEGARPVSMAMLLPVASPRAAERLDVRPSAPPAIPSRRLAAAAICPVPRWSAQAAAAHSLQAAKPSCCCSAANGQAAT